VLANLTEFGLTPYFTVDELSAAGVRMVLYPLSAFRAASKAMRHVYETIREAGTQKTLLEQMQTREELYEVLDYYAYEKQLDRILGADEE
jgi:methylisocitrate lyase